MNCAAYALQRQVAIRFRQFTALYAFLNIALDCLYTARQRIAVKVAQDNAIACHCGDLCDTVAHRACAQYSDGLNFGYGARGCLCCAQEGFLNCLILWAYSRDEKG